MIMTTLPKTIKRWCCQGKSCGNTNLKLVEFDGPADYPPLYNYVRASNDNPYDGGWMTEEEIRQWLEETKNNLNPEVTE